jgi:hypothetical protein
MHIVVLINRREFVLVQNVVGRRAGDRLSALSQRLRYPIAKFHAGTYDVLLSLRVRERQLYRPCCRFRPWAFITGVTRGSLFPTLSEADAAAGDVRCDTRQDVKTSAT